MRKFRVYNRVDRIGVEFHLPGMNVGMASYIAVLAAVVGIAIVLALTSLFGGLVLFIALAVLCVPVLFVLVVVIARVNGMGRLTERTQAGLLLESMRNPVVTNFRTPDETADARAFEFAEDWSAHTRIRNY